MFETPFYHGIIRQSIVGFGSLFSNIKIQRREGNSVTGTVAQTIQVPIAYAPKEKWLVRIEQDSSLENHTYTTLPRMSFEITGYGYDSTRKTNRMQQITCGSGQESMKSMPSPVPYNLDVSLYILTKTQEDALQIIEQILPTFTPEYTLSIKAVPSMNVIQSVPVVLNSVTVTDDYDGDFQTRRFVTHTLTFTLKLNLFGSVSTSGIIDTVFANVDDIDTSQPYANYTATGNPATGNIIDNWEENN